MENKLFKISKALYDNFTIKEIAYTRKTESFYWSINSNGKEERSALETGYNKCFETKQDAIEWMRGLLETNVKLNEEKLFNAKSKLNLFNHDHPTNQN